MPSPFYGIPDPQYNRALAIVNNAINAWKNLVLTFAAENVAMGITASGKTKLIADTLAQVAVYGSSGSLYEAYFALEQIKVTVDMAPFLTDARLTWMKNELMQILSTL